MARVRAGSTKPKGFTLIELMIVVAVIGILASIALPSYNESVRKSRRAQAKADMVELAQMAERSFTVNNNYTSLAVGNLSQSPRTPATARYNLAYAPTADGRFVITATPIGAQAQDRCGTLTLNQAGVRGRSGAAPLDECW